ILGLGARHPQFVTWEVARAIATCEAVYCNLSDAEVNEFLGLYPIPVTPVVFRKIEQAEGCARQVMAGFGGHRRVALVTRGNPAVYGRLARALAVACAARKIPVRTPPGI